MRTLSRDGVRRQAPVVFLVVLPEVRALSGPPPGVVAPVPVDGETQAFSDRKGRLPSQRPQLFRIERVAVIVARPILHEVLQAGGLRTEPQKRLGAPRAAA